VLIASSDVNGDVDVSPKGDPPGFVQVLDDRTLAIPDRPGNRRADTFRNILQNPKVGLFFLIPGKQETLRVSGTAMIVRDGWLRERMAIQGKRPDFAIVVTVEEAFMHCAKCIIRSKFWEMEQWPDVAELPSLARIMIDHGKLSDSVEEMQALIDESYRERLY
jgi:PPOX class probable FMN-dependent enzyme